VINGDYGSRFDVLVIVSTILFIIKYIKIGDNLLIKRETITLSIVVKKEIFYLPTIYSLAMT
jgi:hypothetical protein